VQALRFVAELGDERYFILTNIVLNVLWKAFGI